MKTLICCLAVAGAMLAGVPAHADDANCLDLAAEMQKLKTQIDALQARVQALEHASDKAQTHAMPSTSDVAAEAAAQLRREDAAVREGWKKVKRGLTREEVKALLGEPQKTFTLDRKLVWYYYYPAVGGGSVMFDSVGHVMGQQAPPFSGFGLY